MDNKEPEQFKLKKKKKRSAGKIALIVLIVIVAILIVSVTACLALVNHYLGMIQKVDKNGPSDIIPPSSEDFETDYFPELDDNFTPGETLAPGETVDPDIVTETMAPVEDPGDITWPEDPTPAEPEKNKDVINILIVGQDRRPGESRQRSDSMMVVSIGTKTKQVSVISFLRDLYVQIPGYSDNRLNVAYRYGGFPLLKQALSKNFGVSIDGCFECDFDDFKEIIDYFGGVEITLTEKEAKYMNLPAGKILLNGNQALTYARIRKIDSDFQRTNRQFNILMSLFDTKIKSASLGQLNDIANALLPKLVTDMTNGEILGLMTKLLPILASLDDDSIHRYQVPYEGAYRAATIRKMAVLVPDLAKIRTRLANEMLQK